nr:hypothetical protein BaRGS_008391 [Batillaria attramentaria]
MPGMHTTITADTMTDNMFRNFLQYWNTLKNNTGEMEQINILQQHNDDFVHIEGPPGTGKTLMLLLKILIWLLHGNNMVRETLFARMEKKKDAEKIIEDRLQFIVMERPPHQTDEKYFEKRLHKWAKIAQTEIPDSKVRLVLDETGMTGQGQKAFFNQVSNCFKSKCFTNGSIHGYKSGLSVWSASVEKCGRPDYTRKPDEPATLDKFGVYWKLDMPLRCPPSVQRGLILVQESLDMDNVFGFDKDKVVPHPVNVGNTHYNQYHADGFPVHLIAHGDHTMAPHEIWYCEECGDSLAQYLAKTLRIGQNRASPLVGTDRPLEMRDVLIVATHNAFDKAIPIDSFLAPLNKYGLQVAVNKTREEGDEELPPDDKILVTDITSVHGLERAVIVVIPEHPNPTPPPATHDDDDEDDEDEDDEDEDDEDGKADEGDRDHESMEEDDLSSDDEKDDVEMDQDPSQNSLPNASATTDGDEEIPGSGTGQFNF